MRLDGGHSYQAFDCGKFRIELVSQGTGQRLDMPLRKTEGIGAFLANTEYAHGGISLQECVIPDLVIERGEEAVAATITEISWRGMRCRVAVKTNATGLQVDLRLNWKQAASSIAAAAKELGTNGEASLAVSDDKHEGAAASVVVSDASGRVLDYKPTTVGEDA